MTSQASPLPPYLVALAEAEYGEGRAAQHALEVFATAEARFRHAVLDLLSSARGQGGESWNERCLSLFLLENLLLHLKNVQFDEFDFVFVALGLKPEAGLEVPLKASVIDDGFSTRDLRGFVNELLRRLSRLHRAHQAIRGADYDRVAWEYFMRVARDVSKLTLARYVFSAEEVIKEIDATLTVTKGVAITSARTSALESLNAPPFETEILRRLCANRSIYWVSNRCGSDINAMVEYPLTSAVVVIKPPGSDIEIEIKRAGTRGTRVLSVIRERNGVEAPTSHRLFGGSLGWLAERESSSAGIFSTIFRLVHSTPGPCSQSISNSSIVTVPTAGGQSHILDYLTDSECFGAGFEEMRNAMKACSETFPSDTGVARASYEGESGRTLQFIGQALPQQAVIFGSSSFRLDRIALYLSDTGPEEYFRAGLGRAYTLRDVRWLADSVLEEILCEVVVPPEGYRDYSQYVRDAFRVSENRKRANENYLSAMRQIGECWGTLLAVRGFSDGESFVQRNVGLKSIWKNGNWQVRVIFQDHDDLTVAGSRYKYLWPWREASGMERDQVHILGGPMGDDVIPGEVGALRTIYRVSAEVGDSGLRLLEEATATAYHKTQSHLAANDELRGLFYPRFLEGYRDFDELVPGFLQTDPSQTDSWKHQAAAFLKAKNYDDELVAEYTEAICRFRGFFERMSFLYSR